MPFDGVARTEAIVKLLVDQFYDFLDRPIKKPARILLALLVIPLALSYTAPLWNIHLKASQYPRGLDMDVYSYKLEGGHGGKDIPEINTLNHYIGMRKIDPATFPDLDWLPFALGLLGILALRTAAIGNVRTLVDLSVISAYVSLFAFGRFYYMMHSFGHNLNPDAPFKIPPFTPVIFGTRQVANFTTSSYPRLGSYYVGAFVIGLGLILIWHLVSGRKSAVASIEKASAPSDEPSSEDEPESEDAQVVA
jgi:copper chaperone NosL